MQEQKPIYIGLGSNTGDRLYYLQSAVDAIHYEVGSVVAISSCYETVSYTHLTLPTKA